MEVGIRMEQQLHNAFPVKEENSQAIMNSNVKMDSSLLSKVREKFNLFGGASLIFGSTFAISFYKAGIGFNYFIFVAIMVLLLIGITKVLNLPIKRATVACFLGVTLLGLSTALTANLAIHFLNTIGILILLDLSIIYQFYPVERWDFVKQLSKMFELVISSIASIGLPFVDSIQFLKKTKFLKNDRIRNVLLGICIAIPLLWVILLLLSSADLLFRDMTRKLYRFLFSPSIIHVGILILFGFVVCYSIICGAIGNSDRKVEQNTRKKADSAIAITTLSCLSFVYAIFCGIQIMYLFSNGLYILPQEYTFSEYARRGFFELLTVTVINITILLICITFFHENKLLRILLTGMTICTFIMIASAAYRMLIYIGAYHLTFLRLFVLLFLLIDALVLAGVVIWIYVRRFPMFGYMVVVTSVCYIMFSLAKPDYFIAMYHTNQSESLSYGDIAFLTRELSLDAAPIVLTTLHDQWGNISRDTMESDNQNDEWDSNDEHNDDIVKRFQQEYYNKISSRVEKRGIRDFNITYYLASKYAEQYPIKK